MKKITEPCWFPRFDLSKNILLQLISTNIHIMINIKTTVKTHIEIQAIVL